MTNLEVFLHLQLAYTAWECFAVSLFETTDIQHFSSLFRAIGRINYTSNYKHQHRLFVDYEPYEPLQKVVRPMFSSTMGCVVKQYIYICKFEKMRIRGVFKLVLIKVLGPNDEMHHFSKSSETAVVRFLTRQTSSVQNASKWRNIKRSVKKCSSLFFLDNNLSCST